jgi:hypothetical protein
MFDLLKWLIKVDVIVPDRLSASDSGVVVLSGIVVDDIAKGVCNNMLLNSKC